MYSTDAGAAAVVLRGRERESWRGLPSESQPAELSATQTHGVHPSGTELGTFTRTTQETQAEKLKSHLYWKVLLATVLWTH